MFKSVELLQMKHLTANILNKGELSAKEAEGISVIFLFVFAIQYVFVMLRFEGIFPSNYYLNTLETSE